jgi:uncharacterized membrane protein
MMVLPDILSYDRTRPAHYPNGCVPTDDAYSLRWAWLSNGKIPPTGLNPTATCWPSSPTSAHPTPTPTSVVVTFGQRPVPSTGATGGPNRRARRLRNFRGVGRCHSPERRCTILRMAPERHGAFGQDAFGRGAENLARFFGTPRYIFGQTLVVVVWIAVNSVALAYHWDPYPFILLNLAFSTQAAYAAPLILLAQTRQADRDKDHELLVEHQRERMERLEEQRVAAIKNETDRLTSLLEANTDLTRQDTDLTEQVAELTKQIHALLTAR